ncbi:MAG: hypothetical protein AW09_002538 [Candidatus Accumulibacter phosphatis]|uniref:PEP-CTERM protein-sorting domain-containing protein n=1 Tax=Candidatus Accumulibacter phosphatis TaxID=327160 RepID=A0A080M5E2_9PROT|nr:PEP-CTERM sorting domain-containing protein [Accumulibacter sp.]KFB72284.1 MAG: hypothetical protein AW09_002538 [Candidatus Accumulibacter phosphatis]HCZ15963.1 PEP-CTERM sorting domain-containing protein [Accumulibacter sp.]HRF11473.1 PEP-CTERM sorting domain-containing protein [Candidatus Accumulibacter phosphatis]
MNVTATYTRHLAAAAMLVLGSAVAEASVLNLSTGLDASDTLITLGNTPDAHWTVDQPAGGIAPAKVVDATNTGGAFFAWAANGPGSSWITIDPNSLGNGSGTPFSYYRSFTLAASEVASASISGVWGIDDSGDLKLNGNLLSSLLADYSATTAFSAAAGSGFFVAGLNTLTITMTSSDNVWEAVRLQGALTVPEPSMLSLLIFGIPLARRRGRQATPA